MSGAERAFQELTKHLTHERYIFVCPSPETQGRVVEKRKSNASTTEANNIADVFGWNLPISQYNPQDPICHDTDLTIP